MKDVHDSEPAPLDDDEAFAVAHGQIRSATSRLIAQRDREPDGIVTYDGDEFPSVQVALAEMRRKFASEPVKCLEFLIAVRDNDMRKLQSRRPVTMSQRLAATTEILNRLCGKAPQTVQAGDNDTGTNVTINIEVAQQYAAETNARARRLVENMAGRTQEADDDGTASD